DGDARPRRDQLPRDGEADAAAGTRDDGDAAGERRHGQRPWTAAKRRARTSGRSAASPRKALVVTALVSCLSPGKARHSCSASSTTPAPRAPTCAIKAS